MKGVVHHRPGPDGQQRIYTGRERGHRTMPNVRWRSEDGRVHQASRHHNRTLCEMGSTAFIASLDVPVIESTPDRVTCVECIGYVTWPEYPVD